MGDAMLKKVSLILIAMIIVTGLLIYFLNSFQGGGVPADFTAARQRAASISQDIVNLTGEAGKKIELANQAEANGNAERLMGLIDEAKSSNAIAYQKAFDLSQTLQQMAESLNNVRQPRQQLGYEAVAVELSLVSEFISYTGAMNDFLNTLARSVLDEKIANQKAVKDALNSVNQKVNLINSLNQNFIDKMAAFDQAS